MLAYELMTPLPDVLHKRDLARIAELCEKALKIKEKTLISLSHVTLGQMQALNKQTRRKDAPTDVLSFEAAPVPTQSAKTERMKGDIVIAPAYAKKEAERRGISLREELIRLIIHGTLHLYGFDHATEQEEFDMFSLQERLVEKTMTLSHS